MFSRLVFGCTLFCALAAGASAATVEVRVSGVTTGKGKVNVALCDKERFLKQCGYSGSAPAKGTDTVITLKDIPAGSWAVMAYQDENENNELDRSFIGIPKENYGFSRDARGKFGPPGFEDAAIEVKEGSTVVPVKLK